MADHSIYKPFLCMSSFAVVSLRGICERLAALTIRVVLGRLFAALFALAAAAQLSLVAHAEGSRTLYPRGYFSGEAGNTNPAARRSTLYRSTSTYLGVIRQQNFFYVYARAGEYILLGTSGNRNALRLFPPPTPGQTLQQRFGTPGLEDPATLGASFPLSGAGCSNASGNIGSRNAELAGPNSANGSATVTNGYAPCYYVAPTTGIYGVFFGTASDTEMWDVTVRNDAGSLQDIQGRLFSYSFAGNTGSETNGTYATHYYVTDDGYRYSQTFRGLAPYRYVLYSNPQGFLDVNGDPLYRNVRGQTHTLDSLASGSYFRPAGTGIQAQRPRYPMFFVDVADAAVDTDDGLRATLGALYIPLVPEHPVALSASFSNANLGNARTYVGQGGVFTISTQHALSYQIVIKGGSTPAHDDPAHPENRVMTGLATGLNQQVYWDGLTNAGTPMPAGANYTFEATGRAGEVHFPFLDAEANLKGGPTVTRLNGLGAGESTVYYDDRGYTTNGVNVGVADGDICGVIGPSNTPTPSHSLLGVDSNDANLAGSSNYYRAWGTAPNTGNTGNDCAANGYYGDAKGMDLWALIRSSPPPGTLEVEILDRADVAIAASIPHNVAPGGSVLVATSFGNVGSQPAANVTYRIELLPNLADGVVCTGATCHYDASTGVVTISGLPTSLSAGQWTQSVTAQYTAPATGTLATVATIATSSPQAASNAPDSVSGSTVVASGGTVADAIAQLSAPLTAAGGGTVNVAVTFRNLGPLEAAGVSYSMSLSADLAGVSCSLPAVCTYDSTTGAVAVTGLPTTLAAGGVAATTLSYTAPGSGAIAVDASVATTTPESTTANNTASAITMISTAVSADVTASIAPPAQAVGGTTVNIPMTFRNLGPQGAAGVSYTVTFPLYLVGAVTCGAPYACYYNATTGVVSVTGMPATLQIGQSVGLVATLTAPATGTLTFTASIATSSTDANAQNDSASAETVVVPASHTVSFDSNGGTAVSDLAGTHGATIAAPTPPTRLGYVFAGWYKEPALTNVWDFASDTVTAATTLYARWDIAVYALSYTAGANGSISGATSQSVAFGGAGSAVTAVANAGYHFVAWSDGLTSATRTDTNIAAALAVTASFAINSYTLTYSAGANGTLTGTNPQSVDHGASGTPVTAVPSAGYHFVAWSDGVTSATRTDTNVTTALTVSASFAINSYTLTYVVGANGTLTGTNPQSVDHGASGTPVTAVPNAGYHFVAWSDGVTTATRTDTNVTTALTVSASFAINSYTLTYSAGANGTLTGTNPQSVDHGASGTPVTPLPNVGYRFVAWSDGVTSATRTDSNVIGDVSVSASFVIGRTLTYTASASGTLSGAAVQNVPHGGSGTPVTAVPNMGYDFFRWSDGLTAATRVDTSVTADLNVVAHFSRTAEQEDLRRGDESTFDLPAGSTLSLLRITRGGQQTTIDEPTAADYADMLQCTSTGCRFLARRSGRYELTFVDDSGDAYVVVFAVAPNVGFSSERQTAAEGTTVRVRAVLDDLPIEQQAYVSYSVQNDWAIGSLEPSDLLSRNPQELVFDTAPNTTTSCFAAGHCFQEISFMPIASAGEIRFLLHDGGDVVIGDYAAHLVELTPASLAPLKADLRLQPGNTVILGTPITAQVVGLPSGHYRFDWTGSDATLGIGAAAADQVSPAPFASGSYLISVVVWDLDYPNRPPLELQSWLRVVAASDELSVCGQYGCDDTGTRIPPDLEAPQCAAAADDPAGVLPYRLQVGAKGWSWSTQGLCLETQPGYGLRLGSVSFLSSPDYGAGMQRQAIEQFGNDGRPALNVADRAYTHVGFYYDFEVTSLDTPGQSVAVVIPLPRDLAIPADAVWRKYHAVDGWTTFAVNARNTLHSARRLGDECPSPVASVWNERPGLVDGHECVRIVLEDGGPNDGDRRVNGVVADPGTLAVPVPREEITVTSSGPKGGGGSTDLLTLSMAALLLLLRRARKLLPTTALLAATASVAHADETLDSSPWSIGAAVAWAMGEVGDSDVANGFAARNIPATARVEDRNRSAWRLFGGYRFSRHVSVDGGYINLGEVVTHISGVPVGLGEIADLLPASGAGWEISGAGYLPISQRLELYGRIGAWRWKTLYRAEQTGEERRPKANGLDALGGIGIRYSHRERWQGGLSLDRYRVDGQQVDTIGLTVISRVGGQR